MMPAVLTIDPKRPQAHLVAKAATVLRNGGVVILPTSGLYGLGCDAFSAVAVERIYQIKNRSRQKPLLVLISRRRMLDCLVDQIPSMAAFFMNCCWPGKVTLVMTARPEVPVGIRSANGKVGIRMVNHPVAAALVDAMGGPVTGTSANLSGYGGCAGIDGIDPQVLKAADLVLDAGMLDGGPGSTVVDISGDAPAVLREGTVSTAEITNIYKAFTASNDS